MTAILLLLNDYLISKGKPPLGFLNPWLYGGGLGGLNNIITGSNPGCGTREFSAIIEWDPVRPATFETSLLMFAYFGIHRSQVMGR